MNIKQESFALTTSGRSTIEITNQVNDCVSKSEMNTGLCHVFLQHTSASLMLCENADPDVQKDLETFMSGMVTDGDERFVHTAEGDDDMAAHIRTVMTQNGLTIPVSNGELALGTWQGIFLWEHRYRSHNRRVIVTVIGETNEV